MLKRLFVGFIVVFVFAVFSVPFAAPATGQTIPPRPGCGCEEGDVAEPTPLPHLYIPVILNGPSATPTQTPLPTATPTRETR
jgi:hypothetical protein